MKRHLFAVALTLLLAAGTSCYGQGGIKVTSVLHDDGSRTDTQTDFDSLTAEAKTYDINKKLIQRATYVVDEKGQPLEGIFYNGKGQIVNQVAYTRDALGRTKEQFDKSANGTLLRKLVYHYDPNGRVSGIDAYDAQGNLMKGSSPSTPKKGKSRR